MENNPFIVDLPMKIVIFHSYVKLQEGNRAGRLTKHNHHMIRYIGLRYQRIIPLSSDHPTSSDHAAII